jgi:hypothetical protein
LIGREAAMKAPTLDLSRRRPLWEALAYLFVDCELDDGDYRLVASRVLESGYNPDEVRAILWLEVFPAIECNLRHPAGEWVGFSADTMEKLILGDSPKKTASEQPRTAAIIQEAWVEVCRHLPQNYWIS